MPPPTGIHCLEMSAQGKAWMPRRLSLHLGVVWSFRDFPCECFSCPFQVSSSLFLLSLFHPLPHPYPPHLYFPFVPGQNHQFGKDDGLRAHFCLTDFTTPTVYRDQSVPFFCSRRCAGESCFLHVDGPQGGMEQREGFSHLSQSSLLLLLLLLRLGRPEPPLSFGWLAALESSLLLPLQLIFH